MIEGLGIAFVAVLAVGSIIRAVLRGIARSDAATSLESCLDREDVKGVRSLLLVRGHLLLPDVRDAAKVWLLERENEAAEKRG